MRMATENLNMSCDFIRSEGLKYAYDDDLRKYFLGMFEDNPVDKLNFLTSTKSNLLSVQTSNPFISHMHIIPKKGVNLLSTKLSSGVDGFLDEYKEDVASGEGRRSIPQWIDSHPVLDEKVTVLDQKFTVLDQKFTVLDQKFTVLDEKVTGLELVIENETNVNIRRIAEGHCDLVRNLREARKVDDEKELLAIRVTVLESDMSKVKHQLAIT